MISPEELVRRALERCKHHRQPGVGGFCRECLLAESAFLGGGLARVQLLDKRPGRPVTLNYDLHGGSGSEPPDRGASVNEVGALELSILEEIAVAKSTPVAGDGDRCDDAGNHYSTSKAPQEDT